jgi:hypothetical protein
VTVAALPPDLPCDQPLRSQSVTQVPLEVKETIAFARKDRSGRWAIYRSRTLRNTATDRTALSIVLVAREDPRPGGTRFVSLDPSALLGLPGGSGPVFAVNAAGDVAFLASDGQRWGIYRFRGG